MDRPDHPGEAKTCCAISAVIFDSVFDWWVVEKLPSAQRMVADLSLTASAMSVFDAWVGNLDRVNGGNLLLSATDGAFSVAYIGYAVSLSRGWGRSQFPTPQKSLAAILSPQLQIVTLRMQLWMLL